ncbi:laminin subunit gamma-1-like isoform X2 [Varroa destructor]|uniref:Laminin subunit gamma-1 n=1 Tax=Varroa destructor TaxID=109461 RepID=A0A7M7KQ51_VARDE|nr:laminin subunit gamma-1-like isoform X2 [Varroa destructor]
MKWPLVFVVIILVAGLCAGDYEHSYEYRRTRTGYPSDHRSELTSDLYSIRTKTKSSSEGVLNRPELWCLCNGRSNKCEFDSELYKQTGNGGRCVDCRDNTAGVNCEKCKDNHHLNDQGICVPCNCDEKGSRHLQCDRHGQCPCKSGVGGLKCDRCLENHYAFSEDGCLPCECHPAGSKDSPPSCDVHTGKCSCKLNVEGQRCDICKPGFFNLEEENDRGCVACFCHGHSAICTSDTSYFKTTIQSEFKRGPEKWTAEDEYSDPVTVRYEHTDKVISVDAKDQRTVYFVAPEMFLGDRRFSYNRYLRFTLRISDDLARYSSADVVIDGADNRQIRAPIIANHQSVPNMISRDYTFQLHESFGWQPPMSAVEFMKLLKDVRSIKIRGTYFRNGIGFLEKVSLDSATDTTSELHDPEPATWVETCSCGDSYSGQFCEQCQPGYRRDPNNNAIGVYAKCIACECHGHSDYCDSETGRCICQHNTTGTYCERCEKRFYGNALLGKEDDCTPCPCPEQGECALLDDGSVTCLACPDGYKGKKCEQCAEGYFGDPQGLYGKKTDCTLCACNDNVDRNSINYCDARTGECLKCIYNTYGPNCETCKPGYYGNATSEKKGDCKRCDCHIDGTDDSTAKGGLLECHMEHGNCDCRHYVVGRQCDRCREGYWNLQSRSGCEPCGCDTIGSKSTNCDVLTGKCPCRPGVTGDKCEVCQVNHYGFSAEGCKPCDCDPEGSSSPQCDAEGQCICRKNFVGRTCNMCKDNTYKEQGMCKDCDYCYTLVQDAVDKHRVKLEKIHRLLEDVEREPNPEKSPDFDQKLEELRHNAEELWKDARTAAHSDSDLVTKLRDLLARIQRIRQRLNEQDTKVDDAMAQYHVLVAYAKDQNVSALKNEQMLNKVNNYLDNDAREALEEATKRSQRASDQSTKVQQISVEIRGLVEKVKEDVDSAMHNAIQAKNQSQIALTLAKQTLDNHQRATDAIQGLKKDQTDLRNMMVRAVQMAKKTQEEAAKAHDIALNELTEANNTILPEEGDIEGISSRARHLHLQASQLAKSADEMYLANKDFFDNAYKAVSEARLIVEEAQRQQQITDHLLDRVSDADSRAKSAVKSGNEILNSARNTLDTLKNFNSIVAKHRDEAQEHIKRIPRIEENIGTVAQKSNAVKELINDAEFKARQSKETAENALRIAKQAKTDISDVANDVRAAQTRANELDHESDRIDSEMRNMAAQLDDLERQTAEENHKVEEVTMGVSNAKGIATETIHQATTALEEVKSILSQLNSIDSYDENRLRELERKLTKLEEDYARGQIAERTKKLLQEKERQNKLMKGYVDDMEALKADVANIRDIRETLPDGCFNPLMIEVP